MKNLLVSALSTALCATIVLPNANASQPMRRSLRMMRAPMKPRPPLPAPPLDLGGKVVLADGSPAKDARVSVCWSGQDNVVRFMPVAVDGAGRFRKTAQLSRAMQGVSVSVTAYLGDKGVSFVEATLKPHVFSNLRLKITPGVCLQGHLVRTNGTPAANVDVCVDALFPAATSGMGLQGALFGSMRGMGSVPQQVQYDYIPRLLPDGVAPHLFTARTDSAGRFTLTRLPRGSIVLLRIGNGLVLTPGSMAPIAVGGAGKQNAGVLVATQTGAISIHVANAGNYKSLPASFATVMPVKGVSGGTIFYHGRAPFNADSTIQIGATGLAVVKNLLPGAYNVNVRGRVQQVVVPEGLPSVRAAFVLRAGPLNGRLLDAAGKPMANVDIMMKASSPAQPLLNAESGSRLSLQNDMTSSAFASLSERQALARTGPDGSFVLNDFPWGASHVIIRATSGCDRAEFAAPISAMGSGVSLRMKPHALVTVMGRLVDPQRRPVANVTCLALHWQPTPRPAWFASAIGVRSDARGRFRIEGLDRGESFSVISNGNAVVLQQAVQTRRTAVDTVGLAAKSAVTDFESPRFVAAREGVSQDLGEIMVHPSSTHDEVLQSYGAARREIASEGVIEAPDAAAVKAAQTVLQRYREAAASGDVRALHILTSRLSADYAQALPEFLLRSSFMTVGGADGHDAPTNSLRFVPRSFLRAVTSRGSSDTDPTFTLNVRSDASFTNSVDPRRINDVSMGGRFIVNDIDGRSNPPDDAPQSGLRPADLRSGSNWVVLTSEHKFGPLLAGILHRENGRWRVVTGATSANAPMIALAVFFGGAVPMERSRQAPAATTPIDQLAAAREAGAQYLRQWAQNRPDAMLRQTSTASFAYAGSLADFKQIQERRPDQGNCPVNPGDAFSLEPIPHLTVWEQASLSRLAWLHAMTAEGRFEVSRRPSAVALFGAQAKPGSRHDANGAGRPLLLQYAAPAGRFLMELVREKGVWKVVEPAMPM